ncbi:hypothetical protein FNL55_15560 [Tardiphaga sp. vice352]|uniref:hypothetical protein n=1 Tax=unclassified Tardiphaga TaxID=2631404 RepID=UPI001162CD14|nr:MULTISPECIES: hypothetical protein [unclassified Tardiphaga]MBC7504256.1 hypothetical protein [Sandarakinorhabdus sp.]QDM17251.1 hypothetical protein FNL53_15875 [Tardiphaga sp. vice278]QDM22225.1 hypothetical protein FIU28_14495 [Tardiphaga sp. vice154]QDM27466.1 hypothetical protein FNL56_16070 [Tardiphaga sp. vice304]QDM32607.1 hypothetical protein FNL55_15560 [Tardiphaga sp. vice352]
MTIWPTSANIVPIGRRAYCLQNAAYDLRQHAIEGGNIEGWRLARRMRDADTLHQYRVVERELKIYLQRHSLSLSDVA